MQFFPEKFGKRGQGRGAEKERGWLSRERYRESNLVSLGPTPGQKYGGDVEEGKRGEKYSCYRGFPAVGEEAPSSDHVLSTLHTVPAVLTQRA